MGTRALFLCCALSLVTFAVSAFADDKTELRVGTPDVSKETVKLGKVNTGFALKDTRNVLFLLDVSGEMKNAFQDSKSSFLDKAKEIIEKSIEDGSPAVSYGLRVYGTEEKWKAEQKDTLVVPIGLNSSKKIATALKAIEPTEPGSLEYSLSQSFNSDLANIKGNSLIVLISAGKGSFIKPFRYVKAQASIENLPAKIVVVNLNDKTGTDSELEKTWKSRSQSSIPNGGGLLPTDCLKQICSNTDGRYYSVADISLLFKDLEFKAR